MKDSVLCVVCRLVNKADWVFALTVFAQGNRQADIFHFSLVILCKGKGRMLREDVWKAGPWWGEGNAELPKGKFKVTQERGEGLGKEYLQRPWGRNWKVKVMRYREEEGSTMRWRSRTEASWHRASQAELRISVLIRTVLDLRQEAGGTGSASLTNSPA